MKILNKKRIVLGTCLFAFSGLAMAAAGQGDGTIIGMITAVKETMTELISLIPVIALIAGLFMFLAGIWAFREMGKQQSSSPNWLKGAMVGLLAGPLLMYFGATTTMFGSSLIGSDASSTAKVSTFN